MPLDHTVLPATRQRCESRLYPQPKQVLDLATSEGCKAELTYAMWKRTGWELNPRLVNRKLNALPQRQHATDASLSQCCWETVPNCPFIVCVTPLCKNVCTIYGSCSVCPDVGQGNVNILCHLHLDRRRSGNSIKLFLNILIQFYLNNVTNLHQLTLDSTTLCPTTCRSYHELL